MTGSENVPTERWMLELYNEALCDVQTRIRGDTIGGTTIPLWDVWGCWELRNLDPARHLGRLAGQAGWLPPPTCTELGPWTDSRCLCRYLLSGSPQRISLPEPPSRPRCAWHGPPPGWPRPSPTWRGGDSNCVAVTRAQVGLSLGALCGPGYR